MTVPARLKEHLERNHVSYFSIQHPPARSAQYAASLLHVAGKEVAKTVVLRAGKQVLLAVLPASYHVNLKKLSAFVGVPAQLVEEQECITLFPDCQPGAVPPFGEMYGLRVYLDSALADDPEIVFCAGTLSESISLGNADFARIAKPRVCCFAEPGDPVMRQAQAADMHDIGGSE